MFLPNSADMDFEQRDVIRSLIKFLQMQDDVSNMADSMIYPAQKRIMDVIVSDSCEYVSIIITHTQS